MTTDLPTQALDAGASPASGYPSNAGADAVVRSAGIARRFEPTVAA